MWPGLPDGTGGTSRQPLGGVDWPRPLILLCALLAADPEMTQAAASRMTDADWDSFTDLVIARHRVAPAIAEAVRASGVVLPDPVVQTIRAEARANGFAALAQKNESLRLAGVLEAAGGFLAEIADPDAAPGRARARLGFYRWHLRMAETPAQVAGVLRFALWRRLRLGLAGLTHSARDGDT